MTRPLAIDDLFALRLPSDPQISPDGSTIAYTVTVADREEDVDHHSIWTVDASGGEPRRLTQGTSDRAPRWSPDGRAVAFLSTPEGSAPQLHLLPTEGGQARRLTDLPLGAGEPVWSPDGRRIAFTAPVDIDPAPEGDPQARPIVISQLNEKADGAGHLRGLRTHLFVVDVEDGRSQRLTFGDFHVSGPVWSPDNATIAITTGMNEDRDLVFAVSVYLVPATGGRLRRVTPEDAALGAAAWRPDGTELLLAGMPRLEVGHTRLFTVDASGGEPRELTPGFDRNVMTGAPAYPGAPPVYVDGGDTILFCARDQGRARVYSVPASGGSPQVVVGGDRVVGGMTAAGSTIAFTAGTWESPGEVFVREDGTERRLTSLFSDGLPDVEVVAGTDRWFTAPDGTSVEGWVLRREDAGRGPLLLDIHGGPHNAWGPALDPVHLYHQSLVAQGWTILCLNPRGSDGYGEAFWRGLVDAGWGHDDQQDFVAAIDALVEEGSVDDGRVAVTGYSYGGHMTCWLTACTDRFAAAVAGGCVSNTASAAGTADLGWLIRSIELARPDYADTLAERSPITHVANVTAPTLLLHGGSDDRCPPGQAEEWFTALRSRRVPTELVLYPGGSHLFILSGRPSHRLDYNRRVQDWVVRYTSEANGRSERSLGARLRGFDDWFHSIVERHPVPGASIAILQGDELLQSATGLLDVETGIEATTDSIFQIGSITKVYTTTLIMQLIDEGAFELDTPVADVLPGFKVADPDVTRAVTIRHLLTHTSGIQGDHFPDTGRGDDAIARFVDSCAELDQSHPLGATMSYCNTGFVIAGRVIEHLTGKSWHAALQERLLQPAGLTDSVTLPEDAMRFRFAFGHTADPDDGIGRASQWLLPWSCAPAGLISATAADVVRFARIHLSDGRAPNGKQILSPAGVKTMQIEQVTVPEGYSHGSHWGVGWILFDWDGRRVFGHDGGTLGQLAFLRVLPEADLAVAMLTNSDGGVELYLDVFAELFDKLAGVEMPELPRPLEPPPSVDTSRYLGAYERVSQRTEILERDGGLVARFTVTGPLAELLPNPVEEFDLHPAGDDLFVYRREGRGSWTPLVFYELDDGPLCIHTGARATPRVSP